MELIYPTNYLINIYLTNFQSLAIVAELLTKKMTESTESQQHCQKISVSKKKIVF